MRIVYYTGGTVGSGRLVFGISIGNALERAGFDGRYTIVHSSPVPRIADDFSHIKIPYENEMELSPPRWKQSALYRTLKKLRPDVLLVNHQWFSLFHFIEELPCKKIYLADYTYERHYTVPLPGGDLRFDHGHYDLVLRIEPFSLPAPHRAINPLVVRNRDEIFPREKALRILALSGERPVAYCGFGYQPGHDEALRERHSRLADEYDIVRLPFDRFPAVDFYNAFDLLVCAGGYNNVWEAIFFGKKALFEPIPMLFSDQSERIRRSGDFSFDVNGADQLVEIIGRA